MVITKEICSQLSDIEIVQQLAADTEYFYCLVERYEKKLLRYVKRIAWVSDEEAEDIMQEALVNVWRHINDYDPELKFSSWLYRIVHNETISYWRKQTSYGKDRSVILDEKMMVSVSDEEDSESDDQQKVLTRKVLEMLPLKYKSILILKFLEGMDYDEISDILKIPPGTVATRINRAKKAFLKVSEEKHISFFE